jgi:cytochrome c-type biogenesis protein CcmH
MSETPRQGQRQRGRASAFARLLLIANLLCAAPVLYAIDTTAQFEDPQLQARYDRWIKELRCLVCQNESIADSNAGLAADLRREVHQMIRDGRSDAEIKRFMTERYGDFVLYRPPFEPRTWLLWSAPAILLAIGGLIAFRVVAGRSRLVGSDADEPEEADRS